MFPTHKNILLTGLPGCGKTTLVRRLVDRIGHLRLAGFYTAEIRDSGKRVGFEAVGLSGDKCLLAHTRFRSRHRVGRYGVDTAAFAALVLAELNKPAADVDLFVIDEIGKMELLCPSFVTMVPKLLDGPVPVVATVAKKGGGVIAEVKAREDVQLVEIDAMNRNDLLDDLAKEGE
jgi:nucleoside-triphosphatase